MSNPIVLGTRLELVSVLEFYPPEAPPEVRALPPLFPESWFIETTRLIDAAVLHAIVERAREAGAGEEDNFGPPMGGYALRADGQLLVAPGCCGDLSDLQRWKDGVERAGAVDQMLWIGHPWLLVRLEAGLLRIQETTESGSAAMLRTFLVQPAAMLAAIEAAERERHRFRDRLLAVAGDLACCNGIVGLPRTES